MTEAGEPDLAGASPTSSASPPSGTPSLPSRFDEQHYTAVMAAYYAEVERPQTGGAMGKVVPEWAIDADTGRFLFDLVRAERATLSIEVGLCQGASAMHFAAAHAVMGVGLHLAIDPLQEEGFASQGRLSVECFGLGPWFRHILERSDRALSLMAMAGLKADVVFVDGDHRFDAVFNDFYWADKMLPVGGLLIFDEAGYDCPTRRVDGFIAANLPHYVSFESPTRLYAFRKIGDDLRDWGDQADF